MSKYTSGELAKLTGVSVRTVQYYDTRGILAPSELSDGGRRLYGDAELEKMRIICFLRDIDLPISSIKELFSDEDSEELLSLLLERQSAVLREEISEREKQLSRIENVKRELSHMPSLTHESIGDALLLLKNKRKLSRLRVFLIVIGILMDAIQLATLFIWIFRGAWQPFALGMPLVLGLGVLASYIYFSNTAYVCTKCHKVFKPKFSDAFFARHTPNTRKLTCTKCRHRGFAVETYLRKGKTNAEN